MYRWSGVWPRWWAPPVTGAPQVVVPTGQAVGSTFGQLTWSIQHGTLVFGNAIGTVLRAPTVRTVVSRMQTGMTVNAVRGTPSVSTGAVQLAVNGGWLMQAVQEENNSAELGIGRDVLARALVQADIPNTLQPSVWVDVYGAGGTLLTTLPMTRAATGVPTTASWAVRADTYEVVVPGQYVQAGCEAVWRVDHAQTDQTVLRWPRTGRQTYVTRGCGRCHIIFVPINTTDNYLGLIDATRAATMTAAARAVWPMTEITWEIHPTFQSAYAYADIADQAISEMRTYANSLGIPTAIWTLPLGYYPIHVCGVYRTGTSSAGMASAGPALVIYSGSQQTFSFVHELGHCFNQSHASGCGAPGASYGTSTLTGVGWDTRTNLWRNTGAPAWMSYCTSSPWNTTYNWNGASLMRRNTSQFNWQTWSYPT